MHRFFRAIICFATFFVWVVLEFSVLAGDAPSYFVTSPSVETARLTAKANAGDAEAMIDLAIRYNYGPVDYDLAKTRDWFQKAAAAKHPTAQGVCLLNGWGVAQDQAMAFKLLSEAVAARPDDWTALRLLGRCYKNGWGCQRDDAKALTLCNQALAAKRYAPTLYAVAFCYLDDKTNTQNAAKGMALLEEAAEFRCGAAWLEIALIHAYGKFNQPRNDAKAEDCFQRASKQGYTEALARLLNMRLDRALAKDAPSTRQALAHAIEEGQAFVRDHPEDAPLRIALGKLIVAAGDKADPPAPAASTRLEAVKLCASHVEKQPQSLDDEPLGSYLDWVAALSPGEESKEAMPLPAAEFRSLLEKQRALAPHCTGPESRTGFCRVLLTYARLLLKEGAPDSAAQLCQQVITIATPELEKEPWDWYLREKLTGAAMRLAEARRATGDAAGELQAMQLWLRVYGISQAGYPVEELTDPALQPTSANLARLREWVPPTSKKEKGGMKMFVIPCEVNGKKVPVQFYIADGLTAEGECRAFVDQVRWIKERRGVTVPADVVDSMKKLGAIARENKVGFVELCTYALNYPADKDKSKDTPEVPADIRNKLSD